MLNGLTHWSQRAGPLPWIGPTRITLRVFISCIGTEWRAVEQFPNSWTAIRSMSSDQSGCPTSLPISSLSALFISRLFILTEHFSWFFSEAFIYGFIMPNHSPFPRTSRHISTCLVIPRDFKPGKLYEIMSLADGCSLLRQLRHEFRAIQKLVTTRGTSLSRPNHSPCVSLLLV